MPKNYGLLLCIFFTVFYSYSMDNKFKGNRKPVRSPSGRIYKLIGSNDPYLSSESGTLYSANKSKSKSGEPYQNVQTGSIVHLINKEPQDFEGEVVGHPNVIVWVTREDIKSKVVILNRRNEIDKITTICKGLIIEYVDKDTISTCDDKVVVRGLLTANAVLIKLEEPNKFKVFLSQFKN